MWNLHLIVQNRLKESDVFKMNNKRRLGHAITLFHHTDLRSWHIPRKCEELYRNGLNGTTASQKENICPFCIHKKITTIKCLDLGRLTRGSLRIWTINNGLQYFYINRNDSLLFYFAFVVNRWNCLLIVLLLIHCFSFAKLTVTYLMAYLSIG